MMDKTKNRMRSIVARYIEMFPGEYSDFKKYMASQKNERGNKFSEVLNSDMMERLLLEYPETLDAMINLELTVDELKEFKCVIGHRWFAEAFPAFRVPEKL